MIWAVLASMAVVATFLWQDTIFDCNDGRRYTSKRLQPYPFHRRFCAWPETLLTILSVVSVFTLGALMGTWQKALLLTTLPGAWFCVTRPTTVDAPSMLLAYCASLAFPLNPYVAVILAMCSGVIHERGPVFAALYAWHPLLLLGLVGVQWWKKAAPADSDLRVGRGLWHSLIVHRQDHDWLSFKQSAVALRGLPLIAVYYGVSTPAWIALGLAWVSRIVGSDLGRFVFWAAPAVVRDLPELPAWVVLLQAVTFRRAA